MDLSKFCETLKIVVQIENSVINRDPDPFLVIFVLHTCNVITQKIFLFDASFIPDWIKNNRFIADFEELFFCAMQM